MPNDQPGRPDSVCLECDGQPVATRFVLSEPRGVHDFIPIGEHKIKRVTVTRDATGIAVTLELVP